MSGASVTEFVIEQAPIACLESVGWSICNGAEIPPREKVAESFNGRRV